MSSLNLLQGNLKFIVSETILFRDASSISFPENFEMHSNAISSFDKFDNSSINSVSSEGIVSGKYKPLSNGIPFSTASLKLTFCTFISSAVVFHTKLTMSLHRSH